MKQYTTYTSTLVATFACMLLIGAGCTQIKTPSPSNLPTDDTMEQQDDAMMDKDNTMMEKEDTLIKEKPGDTMEQKDMMIEQDESAMMNKDNTMMEMEQKDSLEKTVRGTYEAYAPEKLARANTGDVVLFFHAAWCPSCKTLDATIESHTQDIPHGLTILKTDYDTETALKKKYGVTYQHTMVQVDAEGHLIKKWSGGADLASITNEVQ